jgi:hypothetical protein
MTMVQTKRNEFVWVGANVVSVEWTAVNNLALNWVMPNPPSHDTKHERVGQVGDGGEEDVAEGRG